MKCLYCGRSFIDEEVLSQHYVSFHSVNHENYFFKALFQKFEQGFSLRKCYRCDEIITSRSKEIRHNFLKPYQQSGEIPPESRRFNWKSDGKITKFSKDYSDYKNSYDFANPIKLLDNFFEVVNTNFISDGSKELVIKASFSIENYQPAPEEMKM